MDWFGTSRKTLSRCGVLEIGYPFAKILLTRWKWDLETLLLKFLDSGQEYVYQEAGITDGFNSITQATFCCPCMDDINGEETTAMSCNHRFCNNCWQLFIAIKIKEGKARIDPVLSFSCGLLIHSINTSQL